MKLTPVDSSSNIEGYAFDPQQKMLRIKFKGGSAYDYHGVTEGIFKEGFLKASSKGEFVAKVLRRSCPASKCKEEK